MSERHLHDPMVPPEDWVTNEDPNYDLPCPTCSALVENRALHRAWHSAISEKAGRYVDPPRYFDHTPAELADALDAARNGGRPEGGD